LRGDEGFVDFGLFAAEEFEVEAVVGEFEEAVVVVDGGFEEGVGGRGLDLSLLPVFEFERLCGFGFFELFYYALVGRVVDGHLAEIVVLALAAGVDLDCAHWRLHRAKVLDCLLLVLSLLVVCLVFSVLSIVEGGFEELLQLGKALFHLMDFVSFELVFFFQFLNLLLQSAHRLLLAFFLQLEHFCQELSLAFFLSLQTENQLPVLSNRQSVRYTLIHNILDLLKQFFQRLVSHLNRLRQQFILVMCDELFARFYIHALYYQLLPLVSKCELGPVSVDHRGDQ
jgi:hypothetical protein